MADARLGSPPAAPDERPPEHNRDRSETRVLVDARSGAAREDGHVSTRTLLVLAAITGVAILAAGAVQVLLAR